MSSLGRYIINNPDDFKRLIGDVKKQVTKAAIDTVNIAAALGRKSLVAVTKGEFIVRNTFTERQAQFTQMPKRNVKGLGEIKATVGFTKKAEYMVRQDEGGEHRPKSGEHLAIPTNRARSGGSKQGTVRRQMYISNLQNKMVRGPYSKKHKFGNPGAPKSVGVARAYVAYHEKLFIHYKTGIFRVKNCRKRGDNISYRAEQIYVTNRKETKTKGRDYFLPAVSKPAGDIQAIFNSQMDKIQ
jgi:hypothetical protein